MQYFIAFLEGIITFISPCLLPMLPIYITYFAGGEEKKTGRVLKNSMGFVLGFTAVFVLLGALAGSSLPLSLTNALGIALYAMFIAIIIPPTLSVKGVLPAVILATGFSCSLYYIPFFKGLQEGFIYIISAVLSSLITAYFFPIPIAENSDDGGEK